MRTRALALSIAALATIGIGLAGCSSSEVGNATGSSAVQGPAAPVAVPSAPERVDAARFAEVVASPGVTIIDVRTPEEFAAGHIQGAVNYNVQGPDFGNQIGALEPAGTYAVYCRSGNRSQAAVAVMSQAGITGIYELESGIVGWEQAGLPTVS
ncbi:MAG: rhodanese-like domain-containing protein [Actinomycetota bacterium]|nr:rhodanese-like domain-containing protein [Actinomycetota bacterium]MDP2288561.1 rhodanese-like domain-containing protein [Actinomycetota bacterium]